MKFQKGDKVRIMSMEEIDNIFRDKIYGGFYKTQQQRFYLPRIREYFGREYTIRLGRRFTCRLEEIGNMSASIPNEFVVHIEKRKIGINRLNELLDEMKTIIAELE